MPIAALPAMVVDGQSELPVTSSAVSSLALEARGMRRRRKRSRGRWGSPAAGLLARRCCWCAAAAVLLRSDRGIEMDKEESAGTRWTVSAASRYFYGSFLQGQPRTLSYSAVKKNSHFPLAAT